MFTATSHFGRHFIYLTYKKGLLILTKGRIAPRYHLNYHPKMITVGL